MIIGASKAFMEKFGDIWHNTKDNLYSYKTIQYNMDWSNGKVVNVKMWLNSQISNPTSEISILAESFTLNGSSNDFLIYTIEKWVKDNITYKKDSEVWKIKEKWQTAEETLKMKTGDCEDGAVLIFVLARLAGVSDKKLYLTCGQVVSGGHAYLRYRSQYDGLTRIVDWCYWTTKKKVNQRKTYWQLDNYYRGKKEYFKVTDKKGYGVMKL